MECIRYEIELNYEEAEIAPPLKPALLSGNLISDSGEWDVMNNKSRPCMLVCPGGGYSTVAWHEGEPIALSFSANGFQTFVLTYSVSPMKFPGALLELAQAVAHIRLHAKEYRIDPNRIYVCGFSAGGHLAASLGVYWNEAFITRFLGNGGYYNGETKPNGLLLGYPVISSDAEFGHIGSVRALFDTQAPTNEELLSFSLEKQVSALTPPTFLWHTADDDSVDVQNSLAFASALHQAEIPFELHIYPKGPHGISLASEVTALHLGMVVPACQSWITMAIRFFEGL